jgi:hypothetical protein
MAVDVCVQVNTDVGWQTFEDLNIPMNWAYYQFQMAPYATIAYVDPQSERVMQLIIAVAPLVLVFMMRMVLGRSKEMILAVWLSVGWFAIRASLTPSMSFIRDYARPIERLLQG